MIQIAAFVHITNTPRFSILSGLAVVGFGEFPSPCMGLVLMAHLQKKSTASKTSHFFLQSFVVNIFSLIKRMTPPCSQLI
jgi:hypothetical protein